MNPRLILEALWFALPVVAAGLIHIAVIKTGLFSAAARVPLDGGATVRGRRVLGENKSLRGALVMPLAVIGCTTVQAALAARLEWARELCFVDFGHVSPIVFGALLGVGYVVGELPNSFLKRQLDILPGTTAPGGKGVLFWMFDQLDSLFGILLLLCFVRVPPWSLSLTLVGLTLVIHPAVSLLMVALRLKTRIG